MFAAAPAVLAANNNGINPTYSIIGVLVSLVFAYLSYRAAARKGHNAVLWAVITFFICSPLMFLVVQFGLKDKRATGGAVI